VLVATSSTGDVKAEGHMGGIEIIIEIPRGSRNKYEFDHAAGRSFHDGVQRSSPILSRTYCGWIAERSFAWAARFRRLAKDYERLPETLIGLHFAAFYFRRLLRSCKFITPSSEHPSP
jgi:inorganic pyrophosphatase